MTDVDQMDQKELVEAACEQLANPDDGRDKGRGALAEELDVHPNTVDKWRREKRPLQGPSRKMVESIVRRGG